jgi:uncharacterized protein (TIGR00369 family)
MARKIPRQGAASGRPGQAPAHLASVQLREEISGVELFRRMAAGELLPPPLVSLLGFRLAEVEEGHIVFVAAPLEAFYNGNGVVHGGWTAALLDSALGCSINSMMPAGRAFTTLELKVNLTRPLRREVGEVRCEGHVLHLGNRTATAEGRVVDAAGKLYAHGTTTCVLIERPAASLPSHTSGRRAALARPARPAAGTARPRSRGSSKGNR